MEKKEKLMLTVRERLQGIGSLFLVEADSDSLLLQRSIREKTELTEKDKEEIEFEIIKEDDKKDGKPIGFKWEDEKEKLVDPNFSPKEIVYLDARVTALNKEKKLTDNNLDLALKIWEAVK